MVLPSCLLTHVLHPEEYALEDKCEDTSEEGDEDDEEGDEDNEEGDEEPDALPQ